MRPVLGVEACKALGDLHSSTARDLMRVISDDEGDLFGVCTRPLRSLITHKTYTRGENKENETGEAVYPIDSGAHSWNDLESWHSVERQR